MGIIDRLFLLITTLIMAFAPATHYIEGVVGQPESFNPIKAHTEHEITVSRLIYRGLFKYDIYGTLIPDLADTWSVSEDSLTYTIKLKQNQVWSNGAPITADDLIYTAFNSPNLAGVATDKVDDITVRYTLPNKYAPFISLLTTGVAPNGSLEKKNQLQTVTSGDFRVVKVDKTGSLVNEIALFNQKTNINRLVFKYYSTNDDVLTAAKLGEIDGFVSASEESVERFNEYRFPLQGVYYGLFFNMNNDVVSEQKLRQQMRDVLDIDRLIERLGILVQGPISRSTFTDRALKYEHYDENLTADYAGKKIVLTVPDTKAHLDLAEEIADIWEKKLLLDIEIKTVQLKDIDSAVLKDRNFEVFLYGQEIGRDPDRYATFHSAQGIYPGANISQFNHVRADRGLEEGRNELDDQKRITHYHDFQKVVEEQVPVIFLYHPYSKYYVSKFISGIGDKYTFTPSDRFLDFTNWRKLKTN